MGKYSRPIKKDPHHLPTKPIKNLKEVELILNYLHSRIKKAKTETKRKQARRNWFLVLLGFNSAMRAEDLLQTKVKNVEKGFYGIIEAKTKKIQNYRFNKNLYEDLKQYIVDQELDTDDYLFSTQKNHSLTPMTRQQLDRILKVVGEAIYLKQPFSAHVLRKTWAYQKYKSGTPLLTISKMLNHYSIEETLLYIEWDQEDIEKERESTYFGGVHRK